MKGFTAAFFLSASVFFSHAVSAELRLDLHCTDGLTTRSEVIGRPPDRQSSKISTTVPDALIRLKNTQCYVDWGDSFTGSFYLVSIDKNEISCGKFSVDGKKEWSMRINRLTGSMTYKYSHFSIDEDKFLFDVNHVKTYSCRKAKQLF